MLFLAELAGHEVKGRQDEQEISGIKGHRDAIIDGTLVDVKSASSYSFTKFKDGKLSEDDGFGYIPQLMSYLEAGQDDDEITDKTQAAFFVVDKTHGFMALDFHRREEGVYGKKFFESKKEMLNGPEPEQCYEEKDFGKSGNKVVHRLCTYCGFKKHCFPEMRVFNYANGPVYLSKVVNEPAVEELK